MSIKLPDFAKLGSNNWNSWVENMTAFFMMHDTSGIIDGMHVAPSPPAAPATAAATATYNAELTLFNKLNWQMAGVLMLMVEQDQRVYFTTKTVASTMWKNLKDAHLQQKLMHRFNVLEHLLSMHFEDGKESYSQFAACIMVAKQEITDLCDATFTLDKFDSELMCATTAFEWKDLVVALTLEEASTHTTSADIANHATTSPSSGSGSASKKKGDRPKITCYYCGKEGHGDRSCLLKKEDSDRHKKQVSGEAKAASTAHTEPASAPATASTAVDAQVIHFAGNASTHDFSNPHTPLISDASADWITDTGATCYMMPHRHWFFSYSSQRTPVKLTNNSVIYSAGIGSVRFQSVVNGKLGRLLEFEHVLHVPELHNNLLSVLFLTQMKDYIVTIQWDKMLFCRSGSVLFTATVTSSYSGILDGSVVPNTEFACLSSTCPFDYTLWHHRFAHLNHSSVKKLIQGKLVDGIQLDSTATPDPICEPCIVGKQTRADVPKSVSSHRSNLLELVHTDVHGPLPVHSCEGHYQYWITFICDASQWWSLIPLQKKSDAFAAFKQFKAYAENQMGWKIKVIRDDKGGEYMSKEWENLCIDEGIKQEHTLRAEPHQNGVAECANRSISQSITAMLSEVCLPSHFWMDAVAAYVHVRNRSPTSVVKDATPFEMWHKKRPDVSHFRVFGCTAYVHIKSDQRKQLQSHTMKCVFIGYPADFKGWKFWNPDTKRTIVSNSVVFDECYHPGTSKSPIDLSVPGDPVEAGGDKHNQVEFDLPQSPPPLPPAPPVPPAPPPAPAPSLSRLSPPKPSPPAPQSPLPPSSPPAPSTPDPLDSLKCECSVSVGSPPPRKYRIIKNHPPPSTITNTHPWSVTQLI
ncbi:hypothetical protein M0805_000604 [Coniferiporia weirii]|nr:hypothetical protein M0805_000604 [Coniferiporia weirii]